MILEIILSLVLIGLLLRLDKKPSSYPPGPWGIPVIGAFLTSGFLTSEKITQYVKKYGNIFSVRMGSHLMVYIADYETAKTTFNKMEFTGKPELVTFKIFCHDQNLGLISSEDEVWQNGRRFALRQLRDLGLGKTRMQESIKIEAEILVSHLKQSAGKPVELTLELNLAVLNIIWQLIANRRYDINDAEMLQFMSSVDVLFEFVQSSMNIIVIFPWLKNVLPNAILNGCMNKSKLEHLRDSISDFFKKVILEHVAKLDENDPKDYIDHYLLEIEKEKNDPNSTFRKDYLDLEVAITNLFIAGSETTSSALRWTVLLLAAHPDIQKKIQNLIDEAVPRERIPELEDRDKLVYLDAMVYEVLRYSSFVAQSMPHRATINTTINGYTIPKDAIVSICPEQMHYNEDYFDEPHKFDPEHFIDANGKLDTKKIGFGAFSLGRRQCLGETLAKAELFLFTGAILQQFNIVPAPGDPLDTRFDDTKLLFNFAKPYKVVLNVRSQKS